MLARLVNSILMLVVGAIFGMLGTVAHQSVFRVAGIPVPWGLAVSLAAVTSLMLGLRLVNEDRTASLLAALGLVSVIGLLSLRSFGGSVLIPDNTAGVIWAFAPVAIAAVVVVWPRTFRRREARPHGMYDPAAR